MYTGSQHDTRGHAGLSLPSWRNSVSLPSSHSSHLYVLLCVLCSVASVVSDSLRPYRLPSTRLLCPWDSPGKNTGEGCHALLQGIFPTQGLNQHLLCCRQTLYHLSNQESFSKERTYFMIFPAAARRVFAAPCGSFHCSTWTFYLWHVGLVALRHLRS